jgi:hypothetical protein
MGRNRRQDLVGNRQSIASLFAGHADRLAAEHGGHELALFVQNRVGAFHGHRL